MVLQNPLEILVVEAGDKEARLVVVAALGVRK
jgi:hypothetical protein